MKHSHTLDVVVGLLLFVVFTASMLLVLITGANAYKKISVSMEEQYKERTCLNYIAAKIRHCNSAGSVSVGDSEGVNTLVFTEEYDGEYYITLVYYYEGYIRELFTPADIEIPISEGTEIIAADSLSISEISDGLIHISCEAEGRSADMFISVLEETGGSV